MLRESGYLPDHLRRYGLRNRTRQAQGEAVLRLEGHVEGCRVLHDCATADSVTRSAAVLLEACVINELRLNMILGSLYSAALAGRTWSWSATEFALALHGKSDGPTYVRRRPTLHQPPTKPRAVP